MRKQFENVDCKYGAPMGRPEVHTDFSGRARCFKVNLDNGGYDEGGCYWGFDLTNKTSLYCTTNNKGYDGFLLFTRANSRQEAKVIFQIRAQNCLYPTLKNVTIKYPAIKWIN